MKWRFLLALACALIFSLPSASGQSSTAASPNPAPAHLSKKTREDLIRAFTAEIVYIRTSFPMGKTGLTLKDGVVSPTGQKLQQELAMWGPSVKAGDEARLTAIVIKEDKIRFEINGGPVKKQKWYNHIQVGVGGTGSAVSPSDANANPRGSYVDLVFDRYVPELDPPQLKALLHPVFDFDAKTALEAFLDTVPPKVADAIKNHRVLVGMDREMVIYSLGRPPRKIREKDGETEYEDWVYGDPPQDVNFVRFVGDDVVRVETMKVDGTKMVRTEKEMDVTPQPSVAKAGSESRPANAPTLRRPGEESPDTQRDLGTNPVVPPAGTDTPPSTHPLQGLTQAQSLPPTWLAQDGPLH
jgi:hypothetical protein